MSAGNHPTRRLMGVALLVLTQLTACGLWQRAEPPPVANGSSPARPRETPGAQPLSRYGNPEFYDVLGKRYHPLKSSANYRERGIASWYGKDFHGALTSTRETYDMYQMTAAHKLLPLPTWVEVTNLANGRKATLRVNDRGPFKDNRIIDLSYTAALKLDIVTAGTAFVEVRALSFDAVPVESGPIMLPGVPAFAPGQAQRMFLQVGAFGERANAERLKVRIESEFAGKVLIREAPQAASQLYKVQLGPIRDVAHADQAVLTLEELGIAEHHFVNELEE